LPAGPGARPVFDVHRWIECFVDLTFKRNPFPFEVPLPSRAAEVALEREIARRLVLVVLVHAGDEGLIGDEENNIIKPVIADLKNKGKLVFGPYPADGFFGSGQYQKFDGILAMYHDQGLVPFKYIDFENGVNFTAGLPTVRTSPDHGTAYSIAGKNIADERSMRQAEFLRQANFR
jgi:4-hydroxy-L-threonine phosphate dehydrogenase PdxA